MQRVQQLITVLKLFYTEHIQKRLTKMKNYQYALPSQNQAK